MARHARPHVRTSASPQRRRVISLAAATALAAGALAAVGTSSASAEPGSTTVTVLPGSTFFQGSPSVGVPGDAPPGLGDGSVRGDGVAKANAYVTPEILFGRSVTVGEVADISWWTKKAGTADTPDWYAVVYTANYAGDVSPANWYGDRLNAEPYFSAGLDAPSDQWNHWSSTGSTNRLRWFESTLGYFGSYTDPSWADLAGAKPLSGVGTYGDKPIALFSLQTGSAWASGFVGQVDGLTVTLTDGSVGTVDFEADCTTTCYVNGTTGLDTNSGTSPGEAKKTITAGLASVAAGGTVVVAPGTYAEDVVVSKPGVTLTGDGSATRPVVSGPVGGPLTTVEVNGSGDGAVIRDLTVTRAGNAAATWTDALNNQGIAVYADGVTVEDVLVTGNRNGVFAYGARDLTLRGSDIVDNRTGVHLVNDVTGLSITNNRIEDNWTMGILFRDEGTNATGAVEVRDNLVDGNWYSDLEARSLFTNHDVDIDARGNWWGTITPTVTAAPTSGEPGYSGQIPVEFGGTSVPPAQQTGTVVWNPANAANPVRDAPFRCTAAGTDTGLGFVPTGPLSDAQGRCITFTGFFAPVDNLPTVNVAKAGQTIPVKWRLTYQDGSPVSDPSVIRVASASYACATGVAADTIETYAASSSGLTYQGDGYWLYSWKTSKDVKGTCRTLTVSATSAGSTSANFSFK